MLNRAYRIDRYRYRAEYAGDELAAVIADWLETEPKSDPEYDYTVYSCEMMTGRKFTFGYVEEGEGELYLKLCSTCGKKMGKQDQTSDGTYSAWCTNCAPQFCYSCGDKLREDNVSSNGTILNWCDNCIPF